MDINRIQQSPPEQFSGQDFAAAIGKDFIAPYIGEDQSSKTAESAKQNKEDKKKVQGDKPASVSLLNRETDVKDLFENAAQKLAKMNIQQGQKQLQADIENYFKTEIKEKTTDIVSITQGVIQNKGQEIQKKSTTVDPGLRPGSTVPATTAQMAAAAQSTQPLQIKKSQQKDLQDYISLYAESEIEGKGEKKHHAEQIKQVLLNQGVPPKKLRAMESNVQKFIQGDIKKKIKKAFTNLALTYTPGKMSFDLMKRAKELDALKEMTKGPANDEIDEARSELRAYVSQELDQAMTESKIKGESIKSMIAAFDKFNAVAGLAKFDTQSYMKNFQKKLDDQGLTPFEDPDKFRILDTDSKKSDNGQNNQKQQESLEDEIRALYTEKAIKRDLKSTIEITLKLSKMKNGLKALGRADEATLKRLQAEGEGIAKMKLTDLLRESLEERATLQSFDGPQFRLVQTKLKYAMKGLKKLDAAIPKKQILAMRDEINKGMFSIVKEEYLKTEVALEASPKNVFLNQRRKNYLAILNRLKEESGITEVIKPKMFQSMSFSSESKVMEAA